MKKQIKILSAAAIMLLLGYGIAGAVQVQLQPNLIPQFVEPLPLLEFEFINATSLDFTGEGILDPLGAGLNGTSFNVNAEEFRSQILPSKAKWPTAPATCGADTASSTYGYRTGTSTGIDGTGIHTTYLGPVVIAETGVASNPTYGNNIPDATTGPMGVVQSNMPIDETLDWAMAAENGTGPVGCDPTEAGYVTNTDCLDMYPFYSGQMPIATHLHGGEVAPAFDGGPDAWFTQGALITGPGYPGATYNYPNNQQESLIWFHDHALGITRLNVYAGLAGIQPIIDPANPPLTALPQLKDGYHVPLIIQDRTFDDTCEIFYNLASNPQPNPMVHPFWIPEFIGDTIVVNGKTWPYFDVEPRQYRFSFVNGSNARFYELTFTESIKAQVLKQFVIATDDGYLEKVANTPLLVIGPGERYEVIVDFSKYDGKEIVLMNTARTPYPGGGPVVAGLTDTVMKFRVNVQFNKLVPDTNVKSSSRIRSTPLHKIQKAHNPAMGSITRQLTLNESASALGPLELVINNSKFNLLGLDPSCTTTACRETEIPQVGDTEIWEIINISADAHPMHTHLTSFQVLDRTPFNAAAYLAVYDAAMVASGHFDGEGPPYQYNNLNADGAIGGNPAIGFYLDPLPRPSLNYEKGWKDTVIAYPGEVTRIAVRWAPTDIAVGDETPGINQYIGFDPSNLVPDPNDPSGLTKNVGYVWHCHIIDHEDNEMMRNYTVGIARQMVVPNGAF